VENWSASFDSEANIDLLSRNCPINSFSTPNSNSILDQCTSDCKLGKSKFFSPYLVLFFCIVYFCCSSCYWALPLSARWVCLPGFTIFLHISKGVCYFHLQASSFWVIWSGPWHSLLWPNNFIFHCLSFLDSKGFFRHVSRADHRCALSDMSSCETSLCLLEDQVFADTTTSKKVFKPEP